MCGESIWSSKSEHLVQAPADLPASLKFYVPLYKMKRLVVFTPRNEKNIKVIHRKHPSLLKKKNRLVTLLWPLKDYLPLLLLRADDCLCALGHPRVRILLACFAVLHSLRRRAALWASAHPRLNHALFPSYSSSPPHPHALPRHICPHHSTRWISGLALKAILQRSPLLCPFGCWH